MMRPSPALPTSREALNSPSGGGADVSLKGELSFPFDATREMKFPRCVVSPSQFAFEQNNQVVRQDAQA